jgi:hypothetical protein
MAAAGWQQEPAPPDPAASRSTYEMPVPSGAPARLPDPYSAMIWPTADGDPLPALEPLHPHLERVLAWLVPRWAQRLAAARRARHQQAVAARIAAAYVARDHARVPILRSPAGPAWRGSRYWQR